MGNDSQFTASLLFQASRKIRSLQDSFRCSIIGEEDRSTAKAIFVLVNRICNSLLRRLTAIGADEIQDGDNGRDDEIRLISYLVDSLAQTFELVRNSRSMGHLDFIVRPLESLVKLISFNSRVIVTSVTDHNYTYDELVYVLVDPLKNVQGISEDGLLQDDTPHKIVKLGFPLAESSNILSYSGLAHEIAHFIFEVNSIESSYQVEYSESQYDIIQRIIRDSTTKGQTPLIEEIEQTELIEEITAIVHSWIKETVCDCLAVHIMGPAFLFTLYETLSLLGNVLRWKASANKKYYPPPIVRFANVLKCLKKMEPFRWTEFIQNEPPSGEPARFDAIRQAVNSHLNHIEQLSDTTKLKLDAKRQLALQLTESTMRKLHDAAKFDEWTRKIAFPIEEFAKQLMTLDWKLCKNVPINELLVIKNIAENSDPAGAQCGPNWWQERAVPDFRVILNVGWVHQLVKLSKFRHFDSQQDDNCFNDFEVVNRVLRKSLELTEFDQLFHAGRRHGSLQE